MAAEVCGVGGELEQVEVACDEEVGAGGCGEVEVRFFAAVSRGSGGRERVRGIGSGRRAR